MKILRDFSESKLKPEVQSYPSDLTKLAPKKTYVVPEMTTSYGIVNGQATIRSSNNEITLLGQNVFCLNNGEITCQQGIISIFSRFGFIGLNYFGASVEDFGRLSYIDGCTDTLLIAPPRLGDPCLNALYFPKNIDQSFHSHPSVRLGHILKGEGIAVLNDSEEPLKAGDAFCIEAFEKHRFKTTRSEMVVIAYHPESEWGPTDEKHPMLNRTYLSIQK